MKFRSNCCKVQNKTTIQERYAEHSISIAFAIYCHRSVRLQWSRARFSRRDGHSEKQLIPTFKSTPWFYKCSKTSEIHSNLLIVILNVQFPLLFTTNIFIKLSLSNSIVKTKDKFHSNFLFKTVKYLSLLSQQRRKKINFNKIRTFPEVAFSKTVNRHILFVGIIRV